MLEVSAKHIKDKIHHAAAHLKKIDQAHAEAAAQIKVPPPVPKKEG